MNAITLIKRNVSKFHPSWKWHSTEGNYNETLQIIFGYLPYLELCNCAIVSKNWREAAVEEIQSRCTVNVRNNDEVGFVLQKLKASSNFRVGKCIIAETVDSVLVRQMLIKLQNTVHALELEISFNTQDTFLLQLLVNLPNLTHLTVTSTVNSYTFQSKSTLAGNKLCSAQNQCGHNWTTPFSNRQEKCSQQCCKCSTMQYNDSGDPSTAEKIKFEHKSIHHLHFDAGQNGEFQLSRIFQAFPNLVELVVSNVVDEPHKNIKCQQQRYSLCKGLKHLTLRQYSNIGFSEKVIRTLIKWEMNLKKLMLIFPPPMQLSLNKTDQDVNALLKQFIESQAASIKTLKLIQVEDDITIWNKSTSTSSSSQRNAAWNVPIIDVHANPSYHWNFNYSLSSISLFPINLPNLEVLHVQKPLITNLAQVIKYFPKLKQLSIQVSPFGSNWKGMLPQKLEPHMGITALKLDFIDFNSLPRLGFCFPSLKILQLSYCDESLFNVLRKQIPSFNGGVAKESLIPCQQCHGSNGGKFSLYNNNEPITSVTNRNKDTCTIGASLNKGAQHGNRSFQQDQKYNQCLVSKQILSFKNLKQLRIRPCHHASYENFAFLQNERCSLVQSSTAAETAENKFLFDGDISDADELDSSVGFMWKATDVMKDKKFVDLPLNCSESTESCSSA